MYWSVLGENLIFKNFPVEMEAPDMYVNISTANHKCSTNF